MINRLLLVAVVALGVAGHVPVAQAQDDEYGGQRALLSRDSLRSLIAFYSASAQSPAYSDVLRAAATREAEIIRVRLRDGDFQPGDRILFRNENVQAPNTTPGAGAVPGAPLGLFDSLIVSQARTVTITGVGAVSVAGVLRAEIEAHLARQVTQVQRDAVVHARSFVRLAILGQGIGRPGFYVVPSDALLEQAVMQAGGPSQLAALGRLRIERGTDRIWEGAGLQAAIADGRTIDEMGLQAGDQIILPAKPLTGGNTAITALQLLLGTAGTIFGLITIIGRRNP